MLSQAYILKTLSNPKYLLILSIQPLYYCKNVSHLQYTIIAKTLPIYKRTILAKVLSIQNIPTLQNLGTLALALTAKQVCKFIKTMMNIQN